MPDDLDEKSGDAVRESLLEKHPDGRDVDVECLPTFESCPDLIDSRIAESNVEDVATKISGASGLLGLDSLSLRNWLLKHSGSSSLLHRSIAELVEWMANGYPPWASCRAFAWSRLVRLDKCLGARPIGIGDILQRLFSEVLLSVIRQEATRACGCDQLCDGLEAGMEGAIHHACSLWNMNYFNDDDWGVLLIDAENAFNAGNRKMMLYAARHEWPPESHFLFNLCRHHSILVMRGETSKKCMFLRSKEGIAQGCVLAMIGCGLLILPIMRRLKLEFNDSDSMWHANDGSAMGNYDQLAKFFHRLLEIGPQHGCFPKETKSIFIAKKDNAGRAKLFCNRNNLNFKIRHCYRYLGGFIGEKDLEFSWLHEKIDAWMEAVDSISKLAEHASQSAFAGAQKSLQHEWTFAQWVTNCSKTLFQLLEEWLVRFCSSLLGSEVSEILRK